MVQRIRVKFGTTVEELKKQILNLSEQCGWDKSRVRFVIDLDSCTVKETAYTVSDSSSELPLHPGGPDAVQSLTS